MRPSADIKIRSEQLIDLLHQNRGSFHPVVKFPPSEQLTLLNFTASNTALGKLKLQDTGLFDGFIASLLQQAKATVGIGGYLEKRIIYRRSEVFQGEESRCIHLGVDVWAPAFTPLFAPLEGTIHSFKDNDAFGDYGPTIILRHKLESVIFYTLYGHLSKRSLTGLQKGQPIKKGANFTEIGPFPENGDWPPHLHFQIIMDMNGLEGDFPGVAAPSAIEEFKTLCPDPNLILNCQALGKKI